MSINNFKPAIWSKVILGVLEKNLVFGVPPGTPRTTLAPRPVPSTGPYFICRLPVTSDGPKCLGR
jgi:hypothetical protein